MLSWLPRAFRIKWKILTQSSKVLNDLAPDYHSNPASSLPHHAYDDTSATGDSLLLLNNAHIHPSIGILHLFFLPEVLISWFFFYQDSCLLFRFQLNCHPLIVTLFVYLFIICLSLMIEYKFLEKGDSLYFIYCLNAGTQKHSWHLRCIQQICAEWMKEKQKFLFYKSKKKIKVAVTLCFIYSCMS